MLAPLDASLSRYGACPEPITLVRCLFSKITATMWSGGAAAALCFLTAGCRSGEFSFSSGENGALDCPRAWGGPHYSDGLLRLRRHNGGPMLAGLGAPVDGGSCDVQAVDASSSIPATAQPVHRGKARAEPPLDPSTRWAPFNAGVTPSATPGRGRDFHLRRTSGP